MKTQEWNSWLIFFAPQQESKTASCSKSSRAAIDRSLRSPPCIHLNMIILLYLPENFHSELLQNVSSFVNFQNIHFSIEGRCQIRIAHSFRFIYWIMCSRNCHWCYCYFWNRSCFYFLVVVIPKKQPDGKFNFLRAFYQNSYSP